MKLFTHYTDRKIASVFLNISAGARNEQGFPEGTAHLLEHLLLSGTKHMTKEQLHEAFALKGGKENAYTDFESVAIYASIPNEFLEESISIIADSVQCPLLSSKDFYNEKKIVLQEVRDGEDDLEEQIELKFYSQIFDNRLSKGIAGNVSSVKKINHNDIKSYYKNRIKNNRMALIISCNDNVDAEALAGKYFDIDNKFVVPRKNDWRSKKTGRQVIKINRLTQDKIYMTYPGVSPTTSDRYKYDVLLKIFSNGWTSRLFKKIREEQGLVYSINSEMIKHLDATAFCIHASTGANIADRVEHSVEGEIEKITQDLVKDKELETAKNLIRSTYYRVLDGPWGLSLMNLDRHIFKTPFAPEEYLDLIMSTTAEDILNAARNLFEQNSKRTIIMRGKNAT